MSEAAVAGVMRRRKRVRWGELPVPRVLDEAREQSAYLLAAAKTTIDQQTSEVRESFRRMATEELGVVEKRAQEISSHISENTQEHLRCGLEDFHKKLLDGGNSLKTLSEELLEFLQQNLNAEHHARRGGSPYSASVCPM